MGHRRVGVLPKTAKWREIVASIPDVPQDSEKARALAADVLDAVSDRLKRIEHDNGVFAAFRFLVLLSVSAKSEDLHASLQSNDIEVSKSMTPLALARGLSEWVDEHSESREYAEISKASAAEAMATWFERANNEGPGLFEESAHPEDTWKKIAQGRGFCELSRLYFAKYTERYLRYFLDREASASITSIRERDQFDETLRTSIDAVSKHAFETSQITQSFAAGWFNKHAAQGVPSDQSIRAFLSLAFGKLREEIRREGLK